MRSNGACQILFVDSNTDWLSFALESLVEKGLRVQGVTDMSEAERALDNLAGPQLAFVDWEFAEQNPKQLRQFARSDNRFVIVLSPPYLSRRSMALVFKLGAYDCVGKPYNALDLIRMVDSIEDEVCPPYPSTAFPQTRTCMLTT